MARKDSRRIILRTGEYQRPETGKYRFKDKDAHGNPVNLQADTLEELRELEAEVLRDKLDRLETPGKMTITDFYERWKSVKRGLKPNVMSNYCYMYDRFVAPEFDKKQIKTLKRTDVRTFYNSLVDDGNWQSAHWKSCITSSIRSSTSLSMTITSATTRRTEP